MLKNKKQGLRLVLAVLMILIMIFSVGCGAKIDAERKYFDFAVSMIKEHYFEEVDVEEILKNGINNSLDVYSEYYTKEEYSAKLKEGEGSREALGITVYNAEEGALVLSVSGNSPAEREGITEGTLIIGIKDLDATEYKAVTGNGENSLFSLISGYKKDERFIMKVKIKGEEKNLTIAKEEFNENYVWYEDSTGHYKCVPSKDNVWEIVAGGEQKLDGADAKTAYIRLSQFNGYATEQFNLAMNKYKSNGCESLIIDLRGNGGGFLTILGDICRHFVDNKESNRARVVVIKNKKGVETVHYATDLCFSEYIFKKIVILADEGSASASEAFIGALLDYGEANGNSVNVVVSASKLNGETVYKTYGKGIMQTTFTNIELGCAIKLTTATIYWPLSEKTIHGVGVTPKTDKRVIGAEVLENSDNPLKIAIDMCDLQ